MFQKSVWMAITHFGDLLVLDPESREVDNCHPYYFTEICVPLQIKVCRFHRAVWETPSEVHEPCHAKIGPPILLWYEKGQRFLSTFQHDPAHMYFRALSITLMHSYLVTANPFSLSYNALG